MKIKPKPPAWQTHKRSTTVKLFAVVVIFCFLQVSNTVLGQTISLSEKNTSLQQVLLKIKAQSGMELLYPSDLLDQAPKVTQKFSGLSLKEALDRIFRNLPLVYEIRDKTIIVRRKPQPAIKPSQSPLIQVHGRVVDENGSPLAGATVTKKDGETRTTTDQNGYFTLAVTDTSALLVVSYLGYTSREMQARSELGAIVLSENAGELTAVTIVSTGYQTIPKERATGSFVQLDNQVLNRGTSTSIADRLKGIASGLVFNENKGVGENESAFSIRGRSTINGNTAALIVIDNFPYEGDISNLNPNDVESITILKDAAASSIWGARSSNGVVVITTKKGSYNQDATINVNANVTTGNKPDLFYMPRISSADFIDLTKYLFDKGLYNSSINNGYSPITPAVEILQDKKAGKLPPAIADAQLEALKQYDVRNDLSKYYYQSSISQQYNVNLAGGSDKQRYYFSAGYDYNRSNLVRNSFSRVTLNGSNTYKLLKGKGELTTAISFVSGKTVNNNTGRPVSTGGLYPYARLADENGTPLAIYADYRRSFTDTAGKGKLYDYTYRPLEELSLSDNSVKTTDYRVSASFKYNVFQGLDATISYRYNTGTADNRNLLGAGTYNNRFYVNQFTQINTTTGVVTKPVPDGAILDFSNGTYHSHDGRVQVGYNKILGEKHSINAIAGAEIIDNGAETNANRLYGYDTENATAIPVDYVNQYPVRPLGNGSRILNGASLLLTTDRYVSYFANASYTFLGKYTVSASGRKDESNIFGVRTNQKGTPLWSAGLAWDISREGFYKVAWLPYLKVRITDGYNGNVDKTLSAYTTAMVTFTNRYGANQASIINPPNPDLRWERVNILNAGLDFATKNNRLSGSIEYFFKHGVDLIGNSPIAPSSGVATYRGNNASLNTRGVDIILNSRNLNGALGWTTNLLFSYASDRIVKYGIKPSSAYQYIGFSYPMEGRPYNSVLAYKWGGLDANGNPQGFVNGQLSTDYAKLSTGVTLNDLIYVGPGRPQVFGSLRNNFSFRGFTLSANIVYKLKYFVRTPSSFSGLYATTGSIFAGGDYANRWQQPGDESKTHVPAFVYPRNSARDAFYEFSEVLVEKGDHIRLQDVQVAYDLNASLLRKLPFRSARLYLYANNLGIMWKATKNSYDPDYLSNNQSMPLPFSLAFGFNIGF